MKVCVDPGHGGRDPGATGADGTTEADVALQVAHRTFRALHAAGHVPYYTRSRTGDLAPPEMPWRAGKDYDLGQRAYLANRYGAEAFVSIHANSASSRYANGAWVIYCEGSAAGRRLAQAVFAELATIPGLPDADPEAEVFPDGLTSGATGFRRIRVLRETDMPAVLVEMGFLTNDGDLAELRDPDVQQAIADAITRGVTAWEEAGR